MTKYKLDDIVQHITNHRIGVVVEENKDAVSVMFWDRNYLSPEVKTYKPEKLRLQELPVLTTGMLKKYVRGEVSFKEITEGSNIFPEEIDETDGEYCITPADMLAGVRAIKNAEFVEQYVWVDMLIYFSDELHFPIIMDINESVTDEEILFCAHNELEEITVIQIDVENPAFPEGCFDELENMLSDWISSKKKKYPKPVMQMIARRYNIHSINEQSEKLQKLFKKCVDTLCEMKVIDGLEKRAYCYYNGTNIYPQNWKKSRDDLEAAYELTGDAEYANSLGYIYYYGRCNKGVPEYDKAFKYFSIGAASGYYESSYKLADMFVHGYGVQKNEEIAFSIYARVYNNTYEQFIDGAFGGSFADAALRMGNCYLKGIGCRKNADAAYAAFLQAELAIKLRMQVDDFFGDSNVAINIRKSLDMMGEKYSHRLNKVIVDEPEWARLAVKDEYAGRIEIKKLSGGELSLTASVNPIYEGEDDLPGILITVPEVGYCDLVDKVKFKTKGLVGYKVYDKKAYSADKSKAWFVYTRFESDYVTGKTIFYLFDKPVAEIVSDYYVLTVPKKKKTETSGKKYLIASVRFEGSGRVYDYICDDNTVAVGDTVVVMGYDGETKVEVVEVAEKSEAELAMPVEKYKKILRKV